MAGSRNCYVVELDIFKRRWQLSDTGTSRDQADKDVDWGEINDEVYLKINQSGHQAANLTVEKRDKVAQLKFWIGFSRLNHETGINSHINFMAHSDNRK